MRPTFTEEDRRTIDAMLALIQTGGQKIEVAVDRDFLLEDGNIHLFMLHYFPREFFVWEKLNRLFIAFLEDNREGVAWLPGGHGKTTTLLHWMIYVMCREPQISFIYVEKSEPTALKRSRAIMQQLEGNKKLIHDFGSFVGDPWSAGSFNIAQRPEISPWPTLSVFGTGGAALGNRCNIMLVDDPVTTHNSASEAERATILQWWQEAASTCPYPLPLSSPRNNKYLKKNILDGTTFHMDDLYHAVLKKNPTLPHLWLKAVEDTRTGITLSDRFIYRDMEEVKRNADAGHKGDQAVLEKFELGLVINLYDFKREKGTVAFNRRYQNEVSDPSTQKFPRTWFEGGTDEFAPQGGYPGCLRDHITLGEPKKENFRYVTGIDPASGSSTSDAARCAIVTLGADPLVPDEIHLVDVEFGHFPLESDNPQRRTQSKIVIDHVRRYGSRIALETNNVQAVYAGVFRSEAQRQGMTVGITGHWTTKKKKLDPELGIEAMAPMVENGKFSLPYAQPTDKKVIDEVVEEFVNWGVYPTKDIVMATWFAWRVLQRQLKHAKAAYHQPTHVPIYRNYRPDLKFPPHWTDEQRQAYLNGKPAEVDEDEEEL
jgi:hypothetical protein